MVYAANSTASRRVHEFLKDPVPAPQAIVDNACNLRRHTDDYRPNLPQRLLSRWPKLQTKIRDCLPLKGPSGEFRDAEFGDEDLVARLQVSSEGPTRFVAQRYVGVGRRFTQLHRYIAVAYYDFHGGVEFYSSVFSRCLVVVANGTLSHGTQDPKVSRANSPIVQKVLDASQQIGTRLQTAHVKAVHVERTHFCPPFSRD